MEPHAPLPGLYRTGWRRAGALFVDGMLVALLFVLLGGCDPVKGEGPRAHEHRTGESSGGTGPLAEAPAPRPKERIVNQSAPTADAPTPSPRPIHRPRRGAVLPRLPDEEKAAAAATLREAEEFERTISKKRYDQACQYATKHAPRDGWKRTFHVECRIAVGGLTLTSSGPDGKFGTADDIAWTGDPPFIVDQ